MEAVGRSIKKMAELSVGVLVVGTLILAGCGSGKGSGGNGNGNVSSSPSVVLSDLQTTNLSSAGFPWTNTCNVVPCTNFPGVDKRWDLTTLIPVKLNGDPRVGPALDTIETTLGMTLFDRTSLAATPASSVTRGVIFSTGTAYVGAAPLSQWCANVANAPYQPSYPPVDQFLVQASSGVISAVLYVNLDSPYCTATSDVVIHEIGHALGFGAHFNGFGNGPPISTDFWSALNTLYHNPIGTPTASMVMYMK